MDKKFTQATRKMLEDRIPDSDIKKGEKLVGKAEIIKLGPDMEEAVFHEIITKTRSVDAADVSRIPTPASM